MPLYEYECDACGRRFEKIQKFSDPVADTCPHCGQGPVRKLLSSPAIQFKGSGWYITDYANKGKGDAAAAKPTGGNAAAESSTSGSSSEKSGSGAAKADSSSTPPPSAPAKKE